MRESYEKAARDLPDLPATVCLTIRLHQNGAMSVEGPVSDRAFCKQLLDEAWEAIKRQTKDRPLIVTPSADVDVRAKEAYP